MSYPFHEQTINYYALALSVIKGYSPEYSFDIVEGTELRKMQSSSGDAEYLIALREIGMTLREIGEIYGFTEGTICKKIKRYRARAKAERTGA